MWFSKPNGSSIALVDIGPSSVGAALVRLEEGALPAICYTVRVPVEAPARSDDDALAAAAARALDAVGERLAREGAPTLRGLTGDGSVNRVLVSLDSPWQEARVETKTLRKDTPFVFTKTLAAETLGPVEAPEGKHLTRTAVATFLNGYATGNPYGKRAKRAEIVVLSTLLDKHMLELAGRALRSRFHTHDIHYQSFTEPCFRTLTALYPHKQDFLALSVTNEMTDMLSVKRGRLIDAGSARCGARVFKADRSCAEPLGDLLRTFATRHALPRTVFLLADHETGKTMKAALDEPSLRALWLSDAPLSVVIVQASHFSANLVTKGVAEGDARLAVLALAGSTT